MKKKYLIIGLILAILIVSSIFILLSNKADNSSNRNSTTNVGNVQQ